MGRKDEKITISAAPGTREKLEALALTLGYTWGDRGNISAFLDAIADGTLTVTDDDFPIGENPRRKAILGAIALIQDGLSKLIHLLN